MYIYVYRTRVSLVAARRVEAFVNHRPPPLASNIAAERFFNKLNAFFLDPYRRAIDLSQAYIKKEKKNILGETILRDSIRFTSLPIRFSLDSRELQLQTAIDPYRLVHAHEH